MSDLKMPVLGFPQGGILTPILQSPRRALSPGEYYRADIGSEIRLIKYLSDNRHRILDPYPGTDIEAAH